MRIGVALGGTDQGGSGIGVYVRSILPALAARARSIGASIVALGTPADLAAYAIDGADGIERAEMPGSLDKPALSALWYLSRCGEAAARAGADVLLLPAANRRMTLRSPIPTVAVVHDLAQLRVAEKYDPLRMVYVNSVLTRALRGATSLVAVSGATRDDMVKGLGIEADRIRVVPNGVDVGRFRPADVGDVRVEAAREAMHLDAPYLLYSSRLEHPGKNHQRLLRAFAKSRARSSHLLALAGKDWGALAMLREEAAALGIEDRVRFLGFVPDAVLPGLVAGADATMMLGLCEGFGLPALEALAAGRVVVYARAGALPEVVGSLGIGCDPLDEASITEALDRAVTDEEAHALARHEGPSWAAKFSWTATADGLFEEIVKVGVESPRTAAMETNLLPRAAAIDVLLGRAPLVGSRLRTDAPRGLVSPIESRVHMGIPYGDLAAEEERLLRSRTLKRDLGVALRALIASALAPGRRAIAARSPTIVSARVDNVTIDEALERIFAEPNTLPRNGAAKDKARASMVYFVHPHALNLAAFDADLARSLADGDLVLPDGVGIRVAASLLGVAMLHNVNGTDLLPLLCQRASAEGVPIALVGAVEGIAEACAERLREATPGLSIALVSHGFLDEEASLEMARRLREKGRVIVLVGMGSPLQERWAKRYLADLPEATVITVGGLFDFYSGRIPRAPLAVRELGLEWLFRLAQEPRRLAKRYLLGNPLFLLLALRQRLAGPKAA